ncbi:GTP cyclohydrolase II [Oceanococcus atlanticus]|uniref:GTP cyclohydrolase-2 n=1 Tax=Oceanococcus atlanticus TaxID=1317117 RepID=A0A1Y1SCZ3_9GAMM|nr:GTP cyclohydrolase II [Oceanococcus atlanticus]RZO85991.1 MAG: GTP cyclohydrolase II [Oceanococcus sp.]
MIQLKAESLLPTRFGQFRMQVFESTEDGKEQVALSMGEWQPSDAVLCRLHSECLTGDVLGSLRCDCGQQLEHALARIAAEGQGALLYLRQEGRGIGLANKIRAYALQDQGADTVEANEKLGFAPDHRDYAIALEMLKFLRIARVRLMTNNPRKIAALEAGGVDIVERLPHQCGANPHNESYLFTKAKKLGHMLDMSQARPASQSDEN